MTGFKLSQDTFFSFLTVKKLSEIKTSSTPEKFNTPLINGTLISFKFDSNSSVPTLDKTFVIKILKNLDLVFVQLVSFVIYILHKSYYFTYLF